MMNKLRIFFSHLEEILCAILLITMVGLCGINIITRYLPGVYFAASEDLVVNLFVWLTMLGATVAVKQKAHLSISFLTKKFPKGFKRVFILIQWLSVCIVFLLVLFYGGIETALEYESKMITYSLGWPLWVFTISLPIGSLLFLIRFSQISFREWRDLR